MESINLNYPDSLGVGGAQSDCEGDAIVPFESFCIVCDKAIVAPKEPEVVKVVKKKPAAGTIRVKNPDGTVTTRNANGTKTTRPPLRRGPSSQNRLVVAATNNNAAAKLQPLTRSKTADQTDSGPTQSTETAKPTAQLPFISTIYCSRACAAIEASRSSDVARLEVITSHAVGSPNAPPSPLYIEGSDTSSNPDPGSADPGPACSAPNAIEFFRISREGPDDAWRQVERQRRSSVHPAIRPTPMSRQASRQDGAGAGTAGVAAALISADASSDSLTSLWYDNDMAIARSMSGRGEPRRTGYFTEMTSGRRSTSSGSGSDRPSVPAAPRAIPRSNLSQASLTIGSPDADLPPEFGSAPNHTYNLWNSYHSAFPVRNASGTSASSHRGFVFPGPPEPVTTPGTTPSRRDSSSAASFNATGAGLIRPSSGTIRGKSRTDVTWDSFGKDEVMAKSRARGGSKSNGHDGPREADCTPKQSVEVDGGSWKIRYEVQDGLSRGETIRQPKPVPHRDSRAKSYSSRDGSSSDEDPYIHSRSLLRQSSGLTVPTGTGPRSITPQGRTPTSMLPPMGVPGRPAATLPDLGSLRLGMTSCAAQSAHTSPYVTTQEAAAVAGVTTRGFYPSPRATFNWDEFESKGGKTYEVPKALKVNTQKQGLFFFK